MDETADDSEVDNENDNKADGPKITPKVSVKKRKKSYPRVTNNNPTKIGEIKSSITTMIKCVNKKYKTFEQYKKQCNETYCELIGKIEDAKVSTKKELKLHQDLKMQEHEEKLSELEKNCNLPSERKSISAITNWGSQSTNQNYERCANH